MGLPALAVRPLGVGGAAALAAAAIVFNVVLLPRVGGRQLWRPADRRRGWSPGIVAYPVVVLTMLLVWHRRPEVAAAGWGVLAFGDGFASLLGGRWGRHASLPWNPAKSWLGLGSFVAGGTCAAALLLVWTAPGRYAPGFALGLAAAAALAAALVESLPLGLDDNVTAPLMAALVAGAFADTQGAWGVLAELSLLRAAGTAALVNGLLAIAAVATGGARAGGAAVGALCGTIVLAAAGWAAWGLVAAFYLLGTLATQVGIDRKRAAGIAEPFEARRGVASVVAKLSVPAAGALLSLVGTDPQVGRWLLAGALTTAAMDTVSSEIGKAVGGRTWLATTLRPVPAGTEGGVSLVGTAAGLGAAAVVAGLAAGMQFPDGQLARVTTTLVGVALLATSFESLAGATLERRRLLDGSAVNFLASLVGALLAVQFAGL